MDAYALGLDPNDNVIAKHIDFHPQLLLIAIGGIYQGSGAVKFIYKRSPQEPSDNGFEVTVEETIPLSSVEALRFSPTGRLLAIAGCDSESYKILLYRFLPNADDFPGLELLPERVPSSAAILPHDFLKLQVAKGRTLIHFRRFLLETWPTGIAWSPDGTSLAIAGGNGTITIVTVCTDNLFYNVSNDERPRNSDPQAIKLGSSQLLSVSWSPCGGLLAAQSLSSMFIIGRTHAKNSRTSYFVRAKMSSSDMKLLGGFLSFGRMSAPGEYEEYLKCSLLKSDERGIMNLSQLSDELTEARIELLSAKLKSASRTKDQDVPASLVPSSTISLFLERGPEKALNNERRSLRTMYAISLYRRGCVFSPDGSFLVATCGFLPTVPDNKEDDISGFVFCSYVLDRRALLLDRDKPLVPNIILPGHRFASIDVAFSPHLYKLCSAHNNYSGLPYAMLFAIVAGCDVYIYTTQNFSCIAVFKGESYQTSFLTCVSWSPHGDMLCAFGAFYQYVFLTIPQECTQLYIGDSERSYIKMIVDLSIASLAQEEQLAKKHYRRLYYIYKMRLHNSLTADSNTRSYQPSPPKKPCTKHSSYKNIMQLCLGTQTADEATNNLVKKLSIVPCFVLSRRLYDYCILTPPSTTFTDTDLNIDLLKEEFGADLEVQKALEVPETRGKRSRAKSRDIASASLISPTVVLALDNTSKTPPEITTGRGILLEQLAQSRPAFDQKGQILPVYDKDYEHLATQLVALSKHKAKKVNKAKPKSPSSDVWRYRGWVSSSEDEATSDYYSSNES